MDYRKLAEEAVKAIFDRAEDDGRVMHRDTAIDVAEKAMRSAWGSTPAYLEQPPPRNAVLSGKS